MDYLQDSAALLYRRRRRQRTAFTMIFVAGLCAVSVVYAASYVQGWVGPTSTSGAGVSCNISSQALKLKDVTVNVYNSTERAGLAAQVAGALQKQGFTIATVDNDPLGRTLADVGEIRHGLSGLEGATLAAARMPGARLVQDGRMDASVDLVVGKKFKAVKVPAAVLGSPVALSTPRC